MRTHLKLGLAVVATLALAAPTTVQAQTGCRDELGNLVLEQHESWIHDSGGIKGGNLSAVGAAEVPSWDDTKPSASVTAGAGGGYLASSAGETARANGAPTEGWAAPYTATLGGAFDGCMDTMAVTLHMFAAADTAALGFHMMAARLYDGDTLLVDAAPAQVATTLNPNGSGDVTYVVPFLFRNLVAAYEAAGLDPAAAHDLTLQVRPVFDDAGHVVYLWDTTEVPSGIVFNPPTLKGYTKLN